MLTQQVWDRAWVTVAIPSGTEGPRVMGQGLEQTGIPILAPVLSGYGNLEKFLYALKLSFLCWEVG